MPDSALKTCKKISKDIAASSNAENNYCGDEKLLKQLKQVYLTLTASEKLMFSRHMRNLIVSHLDWSNHAIGAATGITATQVLPEAIGVTIPGGMVGQALCCFTVGFFATRVSQAIFYDDEKIKNEMHKTLPYLHMILNVPIEMGNKYTKMSLEKAYNKAFEILAADKEKKNTRENSEHKKTPILQEGLRVRR